MKTGFSSRQHQSYGAWSRNMWDISSSSHLMQQHEMRFL